MSPFSDTRISQSIPKSFDLDLDFDFVFFCSAANISSAVSSGVLPVVSNNVVRF